MKLLDRISAPFRELVERQTQRAAVHSAEELEQVNARRRAYMQEVLNEFADAKHLELRRYSDLHIGEVRQGNIPALEYFHTTGELRIYYLLTQDQMRRASLIRAMGMRLDESPDGGLSDLIDVKPTDRQPIEHGAVNLGPVDEFFDAQGTRWRFYIELSYSGAEGSFRSGIQTRHFICDGTL